MANQVADNLGTLSSVYYAALHPTQVHSFYKRLVYNLYGSNKLTAWMEMVSKRTSRPAMTFLHVENDRLQLPLTTSGGAGGAGAAVTLTITNGYLNAGTYTPVQPGYKVFDGTNYYTITAVSTAVANAHTMTIRPDDVTVSVNIASGQLLHVNRAVAVIEGSSASQNSMWGEGVVFTNTLQEYRRDEKFTGQSLAQFSQAVTFFDYANPVTGEPERIWFHAELDRVLLELMNSKEVYNITGQRVTNTAVSGTYGLGTTGVIPAIKAWGNTKTYSKVAGWQISDFMDMAITMEKNQSLPEYAWWGGIELNMDSQLSIKDFFPNGAIQYDALGGKEAAIKFGFTSFSAFDRTWHMHKMDIFNRPDFLGAAFTSGDYIGSSIILPLGQTVGEKGQAVDYIEQVTLEGNSLEYGYDHWVVDGMGWFSGGMMTRPTTERAVTFCFADCYGVEVNCAKQLFYAQRGS